MIEHLSADDLLLEIRNYQKAHKEVAEKSLRETGELTPPIMTVLVYNNEIAEFQYLFIGVDGMFFSSKEAKTIFVEHVIPENLDRMVAQNLLPTALSLSMEASMRMGTPEMSVEEAMEQPPTDILIHSFETPENSSVEIYKMLRKDVKVVNSEGNVIDEFELEKFDAEGEPQVGGLFTNILKKFYEKLAK